MYKIRTNGNYLECVNGGETNATLSNIKSLQKLKSIVAEVISNSCLFSNVTGVILLLQKSN